MKVLSCRMALMAMAAAVLALAAACGAPPSAPAGGDIGEILTAALENGRGRHDHHLWDQLLGAAIQDGLVDYVTMQQRRPELDAYLKGIAGADLGSLHRDELKALLLNAYNALTMRTILDHPDVASIRDIDGAWDSAKHQVGGFALTLDEIEHNLLRPYFRDPRIHFAVNCASRSCAPLPLWAFTGPELEEQLDRLTRNFLQDPNQVRIDNGTLLVSRYFDWYGEDFTAADWSPRSDSIPAFISAYATPRVSAWIRAVGGAPTLRFLEYDWALNAAVPADAAFRLEEMPSSGVSPGDGDPGVVTRLRIWITGLGPAGVIVYALAYVLLTILFVPAWPLTVGAGAAYGIVGGTLLVSLSSVTGAALAFLLARYLLRRRVERWVRGNQRFAAIDKAVGRQGWKIVALTRASPFFPFNLQNYAYGLTAIRFWPYVVASWLAMLPGTLLYVYLGAAGADVAEAATGEVDWLVTGLRWVGFAATLAVTLIITRIARRALHEATAPDSA